MIAVHQETARARRRPANGCSSKEDQSPTMRPCIQPSRTSSSDPALPRWVCFVESHITIRPGSCDPPSLGGFVLSNLNHDSARLLRSGLPRWVCFVETDED